MAICELFIKLHKYIPMAKSQAHFANCWTGCTESMAIYNRWRVSGEGIIFMQDKKLETIFFLALPILSAKRILHKPWLRIPQEKKRRLPSGQKKYGDYVAPDKFAK